MNSALRLRVAMYGKKRIKAVILLLLLPVSVPADVFSFSCERMETVLAKGRERTILSGNALVQSEDNIIEAETIELYGDDYQFIHCIGQVKIVNIKRGIELSSRELFYNRKAKMLSSNGNVIMVDKENEMVIKGGFIEDWEEREETIIQIGVRILKKDLVCRSEFARYLRADERLELSGIPVVIWKGDEYRALKIFVDLGEDTIRLEGDIRGKVSSETRPEPGTEEERDEESE